MKEEHIDLATLRSLWNARRAAAAEVRQRLVLIGLRRPARDPEEAAWLAERGESVFIEDEAMAQAAREYYQRKYSK